MRVRRSLTGAPLGVALLAVMLVSLGVLSRPRAAHADDGSIGVTNNGVAPLQNTQVRMAAERVAATIRGEQSWVTCVFTFTNTGPAARVLMGFPQYRPAELGGAPELHEFTAAVDGQALPVRFQPQAAPQPAADYAGWHTFSVPFAQGQTRVVRNTYWGRLSYYSNGNRAFFYTLQTGASWLGPIGQADVLIGWSSDHDVDPRTITAQPPGSLRDGRVLHWHFTDLEPQQADNIALFFRPTYGLDNLNGVVAASSGEVAGPPGAGGRPVPLFADGQPTSAWHSQGETRGAWLVWYAPLFLENTTTLGLGMLPGVAGDAAAYQAHGRPRTIRVRLARLPAGAHPGAAPYGPAADYFVHPPSGVEIVEQRWSLADSPRWQFLRLAEPATVLGFQLNVEDVYPGRRYADVAIAEVRFPVLPEDLALAGRLLPATGRGSATASADRDLAGPLAGLGLTLLGGALLALGACLRRQTG